MTVDRELVMRFIAEIADARTLEQLRVISASLDDLSGRLTLIERAVIEGATILRARQVTA